MKRAKQRSSRSGDAVFPECKVDRSVVVIDVLRYIIENSQPARPSTDAAPRFRAGSLSITED